MKRNLLLFFAFLFLSSFNLFFKKEIDSRSFDLFAKAFELILNEYVDEVPHEQLIKGALKGMFDTLDEYSYYTDDEKELRSFSDVFQGEFYGVGIFLSYKAMKKELPPGAPEIKSYIQVVNLVFGGPASKAGVMVGDYIKEVGGVDISELDNDEVLALLRDNKPSEVQLKIFRPLEEKELELNFKREKIQYSTVEKEMIEKQEKKIGFVRLGQFTATTKEKLEETLKEFLNEGMEALIIDLRNNGGGALFSAIDLLNLFIPSGTLFFIESRSEKRQPIKANSSWLFKKNIPIVILVNEYSASASELFAGSMKTHKRAFIIGTKTYGKGAIQQIFNADKKSRFRLTTRRYYMPDGSPIDKVGVLPDLEFKEDEISEKEKESLATILKEYLIDRFLEKNHVPTKKEIDAFLESLRARELEINETFLRRRLSYLINLHQKKQPPLVDLENDGALKKAIEVLLSTEAHLDSEGEIAYPYPQGGEPLDSSENSLEESLKESTSEKNSKQ